MKTNTSPSLADQSRSESAFGRMMHFWRKTLGMSQEQLSEDLGVSTRHISFLETGRSQPSRLVAAALADCFGLSSRDRAYLLTAAGFSADQSVFETPELAVWMNKSMQNAMRRAEPEPAFALDNFGRVIAVNRAWLAFFLPRVDPALLEEPNMYELVMSPNGLRPQLHNGMALSCGLALYLAMETLQSDDPSGWAMLERLEANGTLPDNWRQLARRLIHTSDYPLALNTDEGVVNLTVYNDTLSSTSQLVQPRLLVGRIYRDDGKRVVTDLELEAVPSDHPLLYRPLMHAQVPE
ncbi:helix-turn-helix domain-containing protein [Microbulbifer hydrolyticus]|uniref:Helix-turn-helix domain-containing protein n=1 Tax=Microbulbifer hydrolyticus TaxID=48074 RepID=A0A6P1TCL6_9GAMM|nr:helix-turn-helix transcriptional regulator [Microbulbifer hydrolyticus]MBB5211909.1 transcriptional regulator with XRE-family HTH domain [Microbulbifer hydrolyticus]QHQ40508.1 helix-turn-helix domain-containing protein [Microbulbifer hydrolyticus]